MSALIKGKKAATPKGMSHNVKVMEQAGYSKKRAEGAAYGEVGMEKNARKDESKAMKKTIKPMVKNGKPMMKTTVKKTTVKKAK